MLVIVIGCGGIASPARGQERAVVSPTLRGDATLHDVCFVDSLRGWTVGDRGTIWHTSDGGETWRLQDSGVDCPLRSIHFVDANNGWAAGGYTQPLTLQTVGVIVRTRDGGMRWTIEPAPLLPALRQIKFFNGADGWAVGEPSPLFPTGAFVTDNGGRTWTPLPGAAAQAWLTGDFVDPLTAALAGRQGALAAVRNRALEPSRTPLFGLREFHRLRLASDVRGWLVGDGGLVLLTSDAGLNWQLPGGPLPREIGDRLDCQTLALHGQHCWVAGVPGTRVLHTPDGGETWTAHPTGQTLPLHALAFADDHRGWAVGALGLIMATTDGGQTWQPQRSGGTRVAILGCYGHGADIPLELFARLSGNDGYLSAIEILSRRDLEVDTPAEASSSDRAHEALLAVGGCSVGSAWRFPVRQSGLSLDVDDFRAEWDRANDGAGRERMEEHVVRQVRIWRPDVVVTQTASPKSQDALARLISEIVYRAVERAADPTLYPEQVAELGLAPWRVKKVYGGLAPGELGTVNLTTTQLAPRLRHSLADASAMPRALLAGDAAPSPATMGFRLISSSLPQDAGRGDFFTGLTLHPGGEARRVTDPGPAEGMEALRRAAERHRNIQALLTRAEEDRAVAAPLAGQLTDLVAGLDRPEAGQVLYRLARRYYESGRWEQAAELFETLARDYPDHPFAPSAQVWLVQYWSSSEAAWRIGRTQRFSHQQSVQTAAGGDEPKAEGNPQDKGVRPAGFELDIREASSAQLNVADQTQRAAKASALAKQIERMHPVLYNDPKLRFPLSVAQRVQGYGRQAERFYLSMRRGRPEDAWRSCAEVERWLETPTGSPPKGLAHCRPGMAPPKLDGRLDDPLWTNAQVIELHSPLKDDADWPAIGLVARDGEFLYLAVHCRQAPGAKYTSTDAPRTRDPDLSRHDRVDFYLDMDRDWATCYRLSLDHRGWTGEDCWGDRTWDPQWYVAVAADGGEWSVEAAIPWTELTDKPPQPRHVWALGVQRIVPGVGFQSWTMPAAVEPRPEGFGLLVFE